MRKRTGEILIRELGLLLQLSGMFSSHKSILCFPLEQVTLIFCCFYWVNPKPIQGAVRKFVHNSWEVSRTLEEKAAVGHVWGGVRKIKEYRKCSALIEASIQNDHMVFVGFSGNPVKWLVLGLVVGLFGVGWFLGLSLFGFERILNPGLH